MSKNNSLRARMIAMQVGERMVVLKTDYRPSVVQSTAYRVKRDVLDDRAYRTRVIDNGVEVERIN